MQKPGVWVSTLVVTSVLVFSSPASAARISELRGDIRANLRRAASTGEKVVVRGIDLGGETLSDIELEPMQIWARDAVVAVHGADGSVRRLPPPDIKSFKGRIVGDTDDEALVFVSLSANGRVDGMVMKGERRFNIGTAIPLGTIRNRAIDDSDYARGTVLIQERDRLDDMLDNQDTPFTCDLEGTVMKGRPSLPMTEDQMSKLRQEAHAGSLAGASYTLRLTLETDAELYAGFGSEAAVTAYLNDLIGKSNIIYQRDLATTLVVGHTNIYAGGLASDPWTTPAASGTSALLLELGTYYATTGAANANYGLTTRSTVAWISGRGTNGGIAWQEVLCQGNFYCGDDGSACAGAPSPAYAGKYGGAYSFNGSLNGIAIPTTVPDPTLMLNGVEFGMPTNFIEDANFWMLAQFTHELGHNVSAGHTHCVALSAQEKINYGVTRNFVDECYNLEGGCFSGTQAAPTEKGTLMSYCHNVVVSNYRQSRYRFWKAGEASEKMLPILNSGLEGATPNPSITTAGGTIPCAAGQSASVAACGGCTYAWQITGGTITSASNISSITYTPSSASPVLTVTVTTSRGCGITLSKTLTTACGALTAPTGVIATATTTTNVGISWNAVAGAASYEVHRSLANNAASFAVVPSCNTAGLSCNDTAAAAGAAYLYKVMAVGGPFSTPDLATTVIFTDPVLTANSTPIKAAHFNELRTAIDAVRTLAAIGPGAYDDVLNSSMSVKRDHILDLRTAIDAARLQLVLPAAVYTVDGTITVGVTTIKKAHIDDLRNAVK